MTFPPLNLDPIMLAAHVARAFTTAHRLAFAQVAPDLTVAQASPNFRMLVNYPDISVEGQPVVDLLWEFVGAEDTLHAILQGEIPKYWLDYVQRQQPDGSTTYLHFQVTPLDSGQPERGLLLLIEDTTSSGHLQQTLIQDRNELRLAQSKLAQANQELQRLNRLKSLFLAMAAHDIRTPLTSISLYSSTLLEETIKFTPAMQREYLQVISIQADRLNRLLSDLLDVDRIEQGELTIKPKTCELKTIVAEVVETVSAYSEARKMTISTEMPEQPLRLWADPEAIWRVLYNLVSNAIKYSRQGGRINIEVYQTSDEIVLQVADDGYGMSEEEIANLFHLYYRTDDAEEKNVGGTGIGLFIVKTLIEAHQGRIVVSSKRDQGSTFTVRLPAFRSHQGAKQVD